jgi:hypothetical protein
MSIWVNWGLVVGAISFIIGDLVLEVYAAASLAVLGLIMLGSGIMGLALDSALGGLITAAVLTLVYLAVHRRPGHMQPKRVSGH